MTKDINTLLKEAVQGVMNSDSDRPKSEVVTSTLLTAEKQGKKQRSPLLLKQLVGKWQLCFITGTKKAQNRSGILLGKGRYLGQWLRIYLSYLDTPLKESLPILPHREYGTVTNQVQIAALTFTLTGPVQLLTTKGILAFDFTQLKISVGKLNIYRGYIRGGKEKEEQFYGETIKNQAFFAYFTVTDSLIAARGKGGGLALWGKL
ncbi:MAG: hypothetical protein AB4041_13500 [Microcystaceae cyanobacterium]